MATITTVTRGGNSGTTPMSNASDWRIATVAKIVDETPTVKTFTFTMPSSVEHMAGQHYEVRLTAEDGYQAARLYSAASVANGSNELELTIALLADGEVSPYLHEHVTVGDKIEIRGPLGKFFIWQPSMPEAIFMIGGGSGVVPLRCILQTHQQANATTPITLLYSARSFDDIIYKQELLAPNMPVTITLTGQSPPVDWTGHTGRISFALLEEVLVTLPTTARPICYVCGMTPFVEAIANALLTMGIPPARIKAERFSGALVL